MYCETFNPRLDFLLEIQPIFFPNFFQLNLLVPVNSSGVELQVARYRSIFFYLIDWERRSLKKNKKKIKIGKPIRHLSAASQSEWQLIGTEASNAEKANRRRNPIIGRNNWLTQLSPMASILLLFPCSVFVHFFFVFRVSSASNWFKFISII